MSELYDRIMSLCEAQGISGYKLCKSTGIQPSVLTDLKMGRQAGLSAKNADKIASYFGVSVSYLLGTETEKAPALTEKDRRDVAKDVYQIMESLESSGELMFDGVPMSEESKAAMAAAMRIGLEEARRRNKALYTPKKYRKE